MRLQVNRGYVLLLLFCVIFSVFSQNPQNDSIQDINTTRVDTTAVVSNTQITKQSSEVIPETNDSPNKFNMFDFIINVLFLVCGVIIGFSLVYFYSKAKIDSILSIEKFQYLADLKQCNEKHLFRYIGLVKILYLSKESYKNQCIDLQYKKSESNNDSNGKQPTSQYSIRQLNLEKGSTESTIVRDENLRIEEENIPNNVIEWKVDQGTKQTNILYFSIPEADGSFKVVNAKTVKEIDCFYKIEIDKNNQKGKLFFISSEFDSRALDNIDYYLNPVCEIENISDRTHAKKINVIDFGTVVLNGDTWKIESNKKLKIRLI